MENYSDSRLASMSRLRTAALRTRKLRLGGCSDTGRSTVRRSSAASLTIAMKFFLVSRFCADMIAAHGDAGCAHGAKRGETAGKFSAPYEYREDARACGPIRRDR